MIISNKKQKLQKIFKETFSNLINKKLKYENKPGGERVTKLIKVEDDEFESIKNVLEENKIKAEIFNVEVSDHIDLVRHVKKRFLYRGKKFGKLYLRLRKPPYWMTCWMTTKRSNEQLKGGE